MKTIFILLTFALSIWSCSPEKRENPKLPGVLYFEPCPLKSATLTGEAQLTGDIKQQELSLNLNLKNESDGSIEISEIKIETEEGIQAKDINPIGKTITIHPSVDTTLILKFIPINDFKLYMLTDKNGQFNQTYKLNIQIKDDEGIKFIQVQPSVGKEDFAAYKTKYVQPIVGYQFKTTGDFEQKQKEYIKSVNIGTSFIHVSEQEVALAGLNFRLQSYWERDSLHAKLSIVNHAEFPIVMDTSAFDIRIPNAPTPMSRERKLRVFKVTGIQGEPDILRKGDRVMIDLTKHLSDTGHVELEVNLKKAFFLPDAKPLFSENPTLVKL